MSDPNDRVRFDMPFFAGSKCHECGHDQRKHYRIGLVFRFKVCDRCETSWFDPLFRLLLAWGWLRREAAVTLKTVRYPVGVLGFLGSILWAWGRLFQRGTVTARKQSSKTRPGDQYLPIVSARSEPVLEAAAAALREYLGGPYSRDLDLDRDTENTIKRLASHLECRVALGTQRYGSPLKTFNGRDAWQDLREELTDAWLYLNQCRMEGRLNDGTISGTSLADLASLLIAIKQMLTDNHHNATGTADSALSTHNDEDVSDDE